jgi:protein-S-isoprenylcysteine O-methyltransferase Ste14
VNDAKSLPSTPWDFKARGLVFGIIYAVGFFVGINLQLNLYGNVQPTYALIGERYGPGGVHIAAFVPVLFVLAGVAFRIWGTAYLSSGVVWNANVISGGLMLSGPYRYVRNPLYFGNVIAAIGIGMLGPPFTLAIVFVGVMAFTIRLISIEERYLLAVHGQAYRDYCQLVPALIPRLTPAPVAIDPRRPMWSDGFWGETFYLGVLLATLYNALFSWQQPNGILWVVLVLGVVAGRMIVLIIKGKSQTTP